MSKATKPATAPRAARPKGAKFAAKKAANEAAAKARLERLQQEQQAMNSLRQAGVVAGDAAIRAMLNKQAEEAAAARDRAEREEEERKAQEFVSVALSGPHGPALTRFIGKGLNGGPCKVAAVVRRWIATQG
jgi:hypothetical protein